MGDVVLRTKDLRGYYKGTFGVIHAVDGVSLKVENGEIVGLAGESGCGKSSFLKLITGTLGPLLHHEGGEVEVEGHRIYDMEPDMLRTEVKCKILSYVPQAALSALNPTVRLRDFVADMLRERSNRKYSGEEAREMLADHFETVNLDKHVLDKYPHELSGGMRQRAVLAISTYAKPSLLLTDEPTSSLDVSSQKDLVKMLLDMHRARTIKSQLISAHDISMLRQLCDRIAIMYAGLMVELGKTDSVVNDPSHPYTKLLLSSLLPLEEWVKQKRLPSIKGRPPDLRDPPPGCRFHPRCPYCEEECTVKAPPTLDVGGRLVSCFKAI